MKIMGLQKLTLLDYPQKTACTVFLGGCNFACPFCQNAELVFLPKHASEAEIDYSDIISFLNKRKGLLDGVCISGGEPLIHKETETLISDIKEMGYLVKLDTNGSFPERLISLYENGLIDYVAMDIKNSKRNYAQTAGLKNIDISKIEKSVDFLMSGKLPFEFRTTVVRELHSEQDFLEIGEWLEGSENYFLQTFRDSDFVIQKGLSAYDEKSMRNIKSLLQAYIPNTKLRGEN